MELKNELELNAEVSLEAAESSPGPSAGLESSGSGPSPEPSPAPSSGRPRNAKGHKSSCVCTLCARIQARIARGEPSQAEVLEQRKQQREQKQREEKETQQKQRTTLLSRKRQEREAQQTALEASIETQARLGHKPNVTLAGEIVGMDPRRAQQVSQAEGFVQGALSRAGITDAKLAEVAAEGIDAMIQRIITDRDGKIVDVVNTPDWRSRHLFWADLLRVKKILGADAETGGGGGGLVIITPDTAKVLPGHPAACVCDQCKIAWEEKYSHLRRAANRERAILTSAVNSQPSVVEELEETEVEEVETDDFGPVE